MPIAILIDSIDNVVVLTQDVKAGETVSIHGSEDKYIAREDIHKGNKMAVAPIKTGEQVIKYGVPIGPMTADAEAGELVSAHNLLNSPQERGRENRRKIREGGRKIMVFPRADGRFGIRNVVMVIPASPDCNAAAEAISDATGCAWMCCDRTQLDDNGRVSDYTRKALGYTGCNPNIHSVLVLKADGEKKTSDFVYNLVKETRKPVYNLDVTAAGDTAIRKGTDIVRDFMAQADAQKREPRPIEGLTLAIQNSGSDWTTAIFGNPVVGKAMSLLTKDGGITIHGAVEGLLCGFENFLPEKFTKREDVLKMLDLIECEHELTFRETGLPLEKIEPSWVNIPEGITTTMEKGYQILSYYDDTPIQGILEYCEQPPHSGAWISTFENVLPPTTALYASVQGAHMHIITTSAGFLYYEIPHMVGIRSTGNEDTFNIPEFKKDFNAGAAMRDGIPQTGEKLYELILDAAEGKVETHTEKQKQRVFHMWYYVPITPYNTPGGKTHLPYSSGLEAAEDRFGKGFSVSKRLSADYVEAVKIFTDLVK